MGWERDQGSGVLSRLRPYSLYLSLGLGPHRKGKGAGADDPRPFGSEILVRDRDRKLALPWGLWTGHMHVPPERRSWSDHPHPHPQLTTAAALSAARDVQLRNRPSAPQHSILGERHASGSRRRLAGGNPVRAVTPPTSSAFLRATSLSPVAPDPPAVAPHISLLTVGREVWSPVPAAWGPGPKRHSTSYEGG